MSKRMSKTLAAEIADRVLAVVSPANRPLALNAALNRHGFAGLSLVPSELPQERAALVAWLQAQFATEA